MQNIKKLFSQKKEGIESAICDTLTMLIVLAVVGTLMVAFSSYEQNIELEKAIEREISSYQVLMESNGGLTTADCQDLAHSLESLSGVKAGSVQISGTAVTEYPVAFNNIMTLNVKLNCYIYKFELTGLAKLNKEKYEATVDINRKVLSHGAN